MKKTRKVLKVLHWLDSGIFPANVCFSCGFSYDELMGLLVKKKTGIWIDGLVDHKEFVEGANYCYIASTLTEVKSGKETFLYYLIIKEQFKFTDYEYCKLAHEVVHLCQQILKEVLGRNKEYEAEAYLHTHLMMQCLNVLRG